MGTLYIVSTPIGNIEDITLRAIRTLFTVDYIACEDTRRTGQLMTLLSEKITNGDFTLRDLTIHKKPIFLSYYDEVEQQKIPEVVEYLQDNKDVALVSDAGTPLIADPGYKLVQKCLQKGIPVMPIPGVAAFVSALTVSGLPPDQLLFLGYIPITESKRKAVLSELQENFKKNRKLHPTVIFYETGLRLPNTLRDIQEVFGDVQISIVRELTKVHEEVYTGTVSQFALSKATVKGEFVVLFSSPQA